MKDETKNRRNEMETREEVVGRAKVVAFNAQKTGKWDQSTAESFVNRAGMLFDKSSFDSDEASQFVSDWEESMSMNRADAYKMDSKYHDSFYTDEEYGSFGVFGTESAFCYALFSDKNSSDEEANRINTVISLTNYSKI